MKIFSCNVLRKKWAAFLVFCGAAVMVVAFGLEAWIAVRPKPRSVVPLVQVAKTPQTSGKHFTGKVHFDLLSQLIADDRRNAPPDNWLRELSDSQGAWRVETQKHSLLGCAAPDFTLADPHDRPWSLQTRLDRGPVVVVFYLGYYCNACVHHLIELDADLERFRALGAELVAVSGDAPEITRGQFERFGAFRFPVLSDSDHAVARSFGVFRAVSADEPEEVLHATFLIGRDGKVCWANCGDSPFANTRALLFELAQIEGKLPLSETPVAADEEGATRP